MVTWYTGRPCDRTARSHINFCVHDSTWEASEAHALDHSPLVDAWVKNDHLGFEVFYVHAGVVHKYRPDFLIRLVSGDMLVLEVKGRERDRDHTKRRSTKRDLTSPELVRLFQQRGREYVFDEQPVLAAAVDDLNRHRLEAFFGRSQTIPWLDLLRNTRLTYRDGDGVDRPTVAGLRSSEWSRPNSSPPDPSKPRATGEPACPPTISCTRNGSPAPSPARSTPASASSPASCRRRRVTSQAATKGVFRAPRDQSSRRFAGRPARRHRVRCDRRAGAGGRVPPSPASACASCARRRCRRWQCSFIAERPFLSWVMRWMAWNHTLSASLVESKMVPAVTEVWRRQRWHCWSLRLVSWQARSWPQ